MAGEPNRREFLKTSAMAGAGFWVAGTKSVFAESKSPNEKLNVACVGVGGMGSTDAAHFAKCGANIVALCDVDDEYAKKTYDKFPNAKRFKDFREMFDKMHKEFDAVSVSTPDHTHAVVTMMAIKHGKHVYTQKPMAHDVYEARMMTQAAADNPKIVTQMGNQGSAESGLREAVEVIQSGAIGPVKEVHVWTDRAGKWWPQGAKAILNLPSVQYALSGQGDAQPKVPATLDWDLWLGTAPERVYQPPYLPFNWRAWWDFGTGALGDMACHTANMAFMACKLGYPTSVEAEMSELNSQSCPSWSVVRYEFPAREDLPPLTWMWYDGGNDKPSWVNKKLTELARGENIPGSGSLLIGEKGVLFSPNDYGAKYKLLPEKDFEGYKPPEPRLPRMPGDQKVDPLHWREWVTACTQDKPEMCMSKFSYAGPLTETVVLGCVAQRVGQRIEWDGPNMKVTNVPEANQYIKREYRKGWSL